jgi:predicted phage terminase large subunit-like protein
VHGWHIDAICEHLEAITAGDITRLLVNIPPGCMKSLLLNVFFPAWEWGPMYRTRWPHVQLVADQNAKTKFENTKSGFREAVAFESLTGVRGDRVLIDDPHSVDSAQSDAERQTTNQTFLEAIPTRLNNPATSAIAVIMQRLHEEDVSGVILNKELGYTHLCLPMEFEEGRRCETEIGFVDPREEDGELLFPERFPPEVVERDKRIMGPYATSGQFQQTPAPRGGGILKRDWWMLWDDDAAAEAGVPATAFPQVDYIVASLDTAYTEKKENDCSALVIMGLWHDRAENPRLIVMNAWAKRLELHGQTLDRLPGETEADYIARSKPGWGLVEWVAHSCRRFRVDLLLIESTAAGIPVEQEIRRLHRQDGFGVRLIPPKGDKIARAYAAQSPLADGQIYAPDRAWADELITQCEIFPKGKHDDLVDAMTQGVKFFKDTGMLVRSQDRAADLEAAMSDYSTPRPIYEA